VEFTVVTVADRPDQNDEAEAAFRERWPEFVFHDQLANACLERVDQYFPQFQIRVLADGAVAAGGWGVPFVWDGKLDQLPEGFRTALAQSIDEHEAGQAPNGFSFMAAAVARKFDKLGLATHVLNALIERAQAAGLEAVVAPVRPTWKDRYAQFSMADYAQWRREDGLSIDPWIRTHQRMGATILKPAPNSMVVEGSVTEWEGWAGMPFPASGGYCVPGALNLVEVDRENDVAIYREDNLWLRHR